MTHERKGRANQMLLVQITYEHAGRAPTLVYDLNNEDHQDRITRLLLWAAHNQVMLHIGGIPSRTSQPAVEHA